jgi:hypothetical protein
VDRAAFAPPQIVGQYDYTAADGTPLYQVVRFEPKDFRLRRRDEHGKWVWKVTGIIPPVPYRLDAIQSQPTVCVVEGEKDCDRLAALGLVATCNSGGASKWKSIHTDALKAAGVREVIILPDNDEPGHAHAHAVARSCAIQTIRPKIVTLPGLPEHGDVNDWLDAGHTLEELRAHVEAAPWLTLPQLQQMAEEARASAPAEPLVLRSMADLYAQSEEELSWVVEGLCSTAGLSLLAGKPKAGKTTLAADLALSVSRGRPWLGRETQQGTVWLLALEEHPIALKQRLRAMGATEADPICWATVAPRPLAPALEEQMAESPPALIIVDTLFRGLGVADANDYSVMVEALWPLQRIARDTGTHILLVHHQKKSESESGNDLDGVLGSTAISGSVDTILLLKKTREGTRVLSSEGRYGQNLDALTLTLQPDGTVAAGPPPAEVARHSIKTRILDFLCAQRNAEGLPVSVEEDEVKDSVSGRTKEIESALRRLVNAPDSGVIRVGTGRKGNPYKYTATR